MMNILIAIMTNTYGRVMRDIVTNDYKELNKIILEQEGVLFWKKNKGKPKYLHYVTYLETLELLTTPKNNDFSDEG